MESEAITDLGHEAQPINDFGEDVSFLLADTLNNDVSLAGTLFGRLAELAEYVDADTVHETVDRCPSKVE